MGARRSHPHPHKTDRKSLRSITIIMSRTLRCWERARRSEKLRLNDRFLTGAPEDLHRPRRQNMMELWMFCASGCDQELLQKFRLHPSGRRRG
jgi:hypothetical protein